MATGLWVKLKSGHPSRISRLHDIQGNRVPLSRLLRNGPRALATGLARLAFDYRVPKPWISYDAQAAIAKALPAEARVLEFGSGMSTLWYAARAAEVVAIDDFRPWYDKVAALLAGRKAANVDYRFADGADAYLSAAREVAGRGFDLIVVDGSYRDRCATLATELLAPGGMIYLDNADRDQVSPHDGDMRAARETLIAFARRSGGTTRYFTDFAPTQLFAQGGLLVLSGR